MHMNDMLIVSVDDHIIEPPDVFEHHVPAKWQDKAPRMTKSSTGIDAWLYEGKLAASFALNAVAGRPKEELGFEPNSYDQIRRGCWQVDARIDDMNVNGVLASLCFGTFPGFAGENFLTATDKDAALVFLQAYNDWHVDEWGGAYPGRFIPLGLVPLWSVELAVAELRRLEKKGVRCFSFPPLPTTIGLPNIHDQHWHPLWQAVVELGMVPCLHIGGGGGAGNLAADSPVNAMLTKVSLASFSCAAEWLWSPTLLKFPELKLVLSEGGLGWLPHFLERADLVLENHGPWTRQNFGGRRPSEVFRERFYTCFIVDQQGLRDRHLIGIDTITFENDYPHADVTWPKSPERLWADFQATGCSDEEIDKITHRNAIRALRYDPIAKLGGERAKCTVGALRAKATHVDISVRRGAGGIPAVPSRGYVSAEDIGRQSAESAGSARRNLIVLQS
jgi:predicted TIM-barrel fold metal-dependent hydrolase